LPFSADPVIPSILLDVIYGLFLILLGILQDKQYHSHFMFGEAMAQKGQHCPYHTVPLTTATSFSLKIKGGSGCIILLGDKIVGKVRYTMIK
jgi:hypothetical protein